MENIDYKNLIKNIIQFNETFHRFEDNVGFIMESRSDNNTFSPEENIKLLFKCQKQIHNIIENLKSK